MRHIFEKLTEKLNIPISMKNKSDMYLINKNICINMIKKQFKIFRNNFEHLSLRAQENRRSIFWIRSMNQEERSLKV